MGDSIASITFGTKTISFSIARTNRKSLGIKVFPDATVKVIAPFDAEKKDILKKVHGKAGWITKQQNYFRSFQPGTTPRRYINGETHLYLGRQYRLKLVQSPVAEIKLYRGYMEVHHPAPSSANVDTLLQQWYRAKAMEQFQSLWEQAVAANKRFRKAEPRLTIRKMEKRWGSCTPRGLITLNTQLIKAPKACIEYIITHELCHLVYPGHNKKFYALLSSILPDWEKLKDRLERVMN